MSTPTLARPLKVAYLFQTSGTRFSETQAAEVHIFYTIRGLQQRGHCSALLGLVNRLPLYTTELGVVADGRLSKEQFGQLGASGTRAFRIVESGVRRVQSELHLPYLALFDSYRMQDACAANLKGFDLMHERYNMLAIGGALAAKRMRVPLVLEVNADSLEQYDFQGISVRGVQRAYAHWATQLAFNAAAKIVCTNTELCAHLVRKWGVPPTKVAALPCAADTHIFAREYDREAARRELGLTNEPVAMWVGRFYAWHNLDLLVESFALVVERVPDAKLVLIGDGRTRRTIEQKVCDSGLQNAVIFTGSVHHQKVPQLFAATDIAVCPFSRSYAGKGGTPLKLFEYMAAGKPVVATKMNQIQDVMQDGETGILIEPDDVNGFANAIVNLFNQPGERERLGRNAQHVATTEYSWERYAERLEQIYAETLAA